VGAEEIVNSCRHHRRHRLLGSWAILFYLFGGLGAATGAVADLLRHDGGLHGRGPCGCDEGANCCGAACCAPAPEPAPASCCLPEPSAVVIDAPSCCAAETAPAPAATLALVARCTCGLRDHQATCAGLYELHLPTDARARVCPPPVTLRRSAPGPKASSLCPAPPDGVPKAPGFFA